ncbi:ABC transporter permease [Streptomyces sp. NL15-2K]|uniref:ABC transporter permease n=1 Tax=Streptomyces sp. NL15-2K TaxID=376149 RepID=UPI000F56D6F4|nr:MULTISPECIES: ABC transporter permease subunit [Actinomycetes]WKX14092.1 ABC transporter permease [Kutzneria buriramensis]GCB44757.1 oligopeptide transport system permease protein oppC [Streptomyces sp. NL15-2K]
MTGRHGRPVLWLAGAAATAVVALALLGPFLAGSHTASVGVPFLPPGGGHLLGTDVLGRDVLNRVLAGGWIVVALATGATVLATTLGLVLGVLSALARRRSGELLFRGLDVLVVIPAVLLLLVLATGFPGSDLAVLLAVALTTAPLSARVVRAAAQQVVTTGYVEVALSRGDSKLTVLVRDILPNILRPVLADTGLRFVAAVYLTSTAGFLGLGAGAPAANWGRMVAENLPGASLTVWPLVVPTVLLVVFTVAVNLLTDELAHRIDRGDT